MANGRLLIHGQNGVGWFQPFWKVPGFASPRNHLSLVRPRDRPPTPKSSRDWGPTRSWQERPGRESCVHPHSGGQPPFPWPPGPRIEQGCPQSAFPARPPTLGTRSIRGMRTSQDLPNVTNLEVGASEGHPSPPSSQAAGRFPTCTAHSHKAPAAASGKELRPRLC